MKFTFDWLKDHLETTAPLQEICDTLVAIGHEVDSVEDRASKYEGFIVAQVVECEPHPNADRLRQCLVNTGKEQLQVVCGAPNVRMGLKVCFSPVGVTIPSNGMVLKPTKIRDVNSHGMICSEAELCLSEESDGIMELPEDAPIGQAFADYMGFNDPVIDIDLTPNRPDCAGVRGLARDLAATPIGSLKPLTQKNPVPGTFKPEISVSLDFDKDNQKACPIFVSRQIKNVKNGPSPKWLQDRLLAIGLRPISALVDITNYCCIGLNRPLHVFDGDKIKGNLTVSMSKNGDQIASLNDKTYTLDDQRVVISDEDGVASIGGVIGGERTGCTLETTNVFVEAAYFDADQIRQTGQKMRIDSDAKYRFERGIDPRSCEWGMEVATRLILDICGGEPSEVVVTGQAPKADKPIQFDPSHVKKLGGVDIKTEDQVDILMNLGFDVKIQDDKTLHVTAPSWRPDIEGRADLVEEILRIYGFDKIPSVSTTRETAVTMPALTGHQRRLSTMKKTLASRGMFEAVTWSFHDQKSADYFHYTDKPLVKIANPLSEDLSIMRQSVLPNLIKAAENNHARGFPDMAFFETGSIFLGQNPEDQPQVITGLRSGSIKNKTWQSEKQAVDFYTIKADVFAALEQAGIGAETMPLMRDVPSWYHPGRSAGLFLGKKPLAYFGEIHPGILQEMGIDFPVAGFEIIADALPPVKEKSASKKLLKTSVLQPVHRDFAFIVDEDVEAASLLKAANSVDRNLISNITLFDVYQGKGIEEGKKSLGITVTLQPMTETLTDQEIEGLSDKITKTVADKTGGVLRG